jgi:hypothetical protein
MNLEYEWYSTDLFRAILDPNNAGSRGHPVFTALLYAFCPMAAKWWLNGADPVVPYDVVWDAASDFASGITLVEALRKREVPDLLGHVKKYIAAITAYRITPGHNYRNSELATSFPGEEIEVTARAGYQAAFNTHFGGDWRNLLRFARAWAFTIPDWRGDAKIQPGKSDYVFEQVSVAFSVPRMTRRTLEWPAWCWRVKNGLALQIVLGMMINDNMQDQLRFALATRSPGYFMEEKEGKGKRTVKPWEVVPYAYSLDRRDGWAKPLNSAYDVERLVMQVPNLAAVAEKGACSPLGSLGGHKKCEHCGFQAMCFTKDRDITSLVYESMNQDAEKFDRTIA